MKRHSFNKYLYGFLQGGKGGGDQEKVVIRELLNDWKEETCRRGYEVIDEN